VTRYKGKGVDLSSENIFRRLEGLPEDIYTVI